MGQMDLRGDLDVERVVDEVWAGGGMNDLDRIHAHTYPQGCPDPSCSLCFRVRMEHRAQLAEMAGRRKGIEEAIKVLEQVARACEADPPGDSVSLSEKYYRIADVLRTRL